ncbi:hypothetical protein B5807_11364 [Epicoccum nigrum]|uniref:Rhodopsin domain-containing protein n=1 Tax=Epicoccum nigrum TaxID=105696 RepID=A0A1Y2LIW8_EPING|nr:hypothetical protein B5807_11364 [Epicoccum nigrum]
MPGGIHVPLDQFLKWPTPNYINPETRPEVLLYIACICGPITFVMLMTRLWVRIFHQRTAGWDDWLMVAGTIPAIGVTVLFPLITRNGFNRHLWDVDILGEPEKMVVARKYILAIFCTFSASSGLIKISILLFYRRLSARVVSNFFRWTTWIIIGFIASSTIAFTLVPLFGCRPISAFWDQANIIKQVKGYKYSCFNEGADIFAASVVSAVQDLITAVLPTFLYWNLHIPLRQKIALFGIFAIGYGAAVLGALRSYYSYKIYFQTYDVTWYAWDQLLVTLLELHVGCFCANAPTFKVFFRHFFNERLTSSIKRSRSSNQEGTQSSKSSASMLKVKVSGFFTKGVGAHSKDGYISEAHTDITVDAHGGVQVQRDFQVDVVPASPIIPEPEPTQDLRGSVDTTDLICDRYYEDIEMGNFTTRNSQVSGLSLDNDAVLSMPQTPMSPHSMRSSLTSNPPSRSPRAPINPEWPLPTTISEEKIEDDTPVSPLYPTRSLSVKKPHWQTWT